MEASSGADSASTCGAQEVILEDDRDPAAWGLVAIEAEQMRRMARVSSSQGAVNSGESCYSGAS